MSTRATAPANAGSSATYATTHQVSNVGWKDGSHASGSIPRARPITSRILSSNAVLSASDGTALSTSDVTALIPTSTATTPRSSVPSGAAPPSARAPRVPTRHATASPYATNGAHSGSTSTKYRAGGA